MQVTGNISLFNHILSFLSSHLGIKNSCFLFGIELFCLNLSICRLPRAPLLYSVDEMKMRGPTPSRGRQYLGVMCERGDPMSLLPMVPVINWLAHSCWPGFIFHCSVTVWPETWLLKEHMWSPLESFGGPESGNTVAGTLEGHDDGISWATVPSEAGQLQTPGAAVSSSFWVKGFAGFLFPFFLRVNFTFVYACFCTYTGAHMRGWTCTFVCMHVEALGWCWEHPPSLFRPVSWGRVSVKARNCQHV